MAVAKRTDPSRVIAKRAEELAPDVPYVRGWRAGKQGADALAEQLRAAGLDAEFPGLKADVNVLGDGVVTLGVVRPEAVAALAQMITAGLCIEMAEHSVSKNGPDSGPRASAA